MSQVIVSAKDSAAALANPANYSREASLVAPYRDASVKRTASWVKSGASLTSAYVAHFAALVVLFPDASATDIAADFTATVPDSKVKGTPAVTKSQIVKVLKDDATLASLRRDYHGAELASMSPADMEVVVASVATALQAALNAVKNAPKAKPAKVTLTNAAMPAPEAPADALDLAAQVAKAVEALRSMASKGDGDAQTALDMCAGLFAAPVGSEERIAA